MRIEQVKLLVDQKPVLVTFNVYLFAVLEKAYYQLAEERAYRCFIFATQIVLAGKFRELSEVNVLAAPSAH